MTAIVWIIYLILAGAEEAAVFSHNNTKHPEGFDVHAYLLPDRVLMVMVLSFGEYLFGHASMISNGWSMIELLGLWLMLPFWHDGAYYTFRNIIEPEGPITKDYNFFSQSETTTARSSFSFPYRATFFLLGCVLYYLQWNYAGN